MTPPRRHGGFPFVGPLVVNREGRMGGGAPSIPALENYDGILFLDQFTGTIAAGSVDGTLTSDGNATRSVKSDLSGGLSINNGLTLVDDGVNNNPWIQWYQDALQTRWTRQLGIGFVALDYAMDSSDQNSVVGCRSNAELGGTDDATPITGNNAAGAGSFKVNLESGTNKSIYVASSIQRPWGPYTILGLMKSYADSGDLSSNIYLQHVSERQWRVWFPTLLDGADREFIFPESRMGTNNVGEYLTLGGMGMIDLAADGSMAEDFSTITDSASSPADNATFTRNASAHMRISGTWVTGERLSCRLRYMSVQAASTYVQLTTTGKIGVNHNSSWVYLSDAILATGVNYKIDVTDDADGNVKVWLNGVLMYSDTLAFVDTSPVTRGQLNNSLTTNDIEFMCFPTALGGTAVAATDRVVCPQKNDTFSHVNDLLFIIRNPTLPTTGSVDITMRVSGDDELHLNLNSSGDIAIKRNTTTLLSVLGVASGGDDIYVYLTGQDSTAEGEVWLSSSSSAEGSFTNVGTFEGTSGALSSDGVGTFVCDSFEVWPFYVEMPFTREAA